MNSAPSFGDAAISSGLASSEFGYHFRREWCRFQSVGVVWVAADQNARLKTFNGERLALVDIVLHLEARALDALDLRFDGDPVTIGRGNVELGPRIDHGDTHQAIFADQVLLGEAGDLEQGRCRIVEHREITRIVDDVGGVAVAPLDLDVAPVHEHALSA